MNEPKPFASLTGSILARKGSARPAMRPQTAQFQYDASSAARQLEEDLGWNDMGDLSDMVDFSEPDETTQFSARGGMLDLSGLSSMTELNDAANDAVAEASAEYEELERYEEDLAAVEAAIEPGFQPVAAELAPIEAEPAPVEAEIVSLVPNLPPVQAERPEVLRQQDEVVERITAAPRKRGQRRVAAAEGRRAAFTLRLDTERHLKLRLACTLTGKSAQQLVTEALDKLISELPDVSALAVKVSQGRQ